MRIPIFLLTNHFKCKIVCTIIILFCYLSTKIIGFKSNKDPFCERLTAQFFQ